MVRASARQSAVAWRIAYTGVKSFVCTVLSQRVRLVNIGQLSAAVGLFARCNEFRSPTRRFVIPSDGFMVEFIREIAHFCVAFTSCCQVRFCCDHILNGDRIVLSEHTKQIRGGRPSRGRSPVHRILKRDFAICMASSRGASGSGSLDEQSVGFLICQRINAEQQPYSAARCTSGFRRPCLPARIALQPGSCCRAALSIAFLVSATGR